jgi:hypothetical protein
MKKNQMLLGIVLLCISFSAMAVEKGEALCIGTYLDHVDASNFALAKQSCKLVTEGEAICIETYLTKIDKSSFLNAKKACK